jgi:hypothetical protein
MTREKTQPNQHRRMIEANKREENSGQSQAITFSQSQKSQFEGKESKNPDRQPLPQKNLTSYHASWMPGVDSCFPI